ncbi:M48 family metallopeptidase [bacterium]|nr:M48 family metallopeptidase [bacterium]
MTSTTLFYLFLFFYTVHAGWELLLTYLNMQHIKQHRHEIPAYFQDKIDQPTYQKSIDYTLTKSRFEIITTLVDSAALWCFLLANGLNEVDYFLRNYELSPLFHSVCFIFTLGFLSSILGFPFSLYHHFVIEKRFGFNKMTLATFVLDKIKALALSLILGGPILLLLFYLWDKAGSAWWAYAFLSLFAFQMLLAAIFPTVLAPLFNKFTPLPDGALKDAIYNLARKINFNMSGIFTIDGSKRSSHSNAYFAGMGRLRRIVLFDTLEKQMTQDEIIAVLAHEMGHNIKKHVQKNLILSFISTFISFYVLSLLYTYPPFYEAFAITTPSTHMALTLFGLFSGAFTFMITPLLTGLSRKHEYEADAFSVETTHDKQSMISSLVKLSKENLSNLTPHPWYSFYHYSHPTTLERVKAIEKIPV